MKNLIKTATLTATAIMSTGNVYAGEQKFPEYELNCELHKMPDTIDPSNPLEGLKPVKVYARIFTRPATREDGIEDEKLLGKPFDQSAIDLNSEGVRVSWIISGNRPNLQIHFQNGASGSDGLNTRTSYLSVSQANRTMSCLLKRLGR